MKDNEQGMTSLKGGVGERQGLTDEQATGTHRRQNTEY